MAPVPSSMVDSKYCVLFLASGNREMSVDFRRFSSIARSLKRKSSIAESHFSTFFEFSHSLDLKRKIRLRVLDDGVDPIWDDCPERRAALERTSVGGAEQREMYPDLDICEYK